MTAGRSLCWKLNWYRQSELEGALLLGRVIRAAEDPALVLALTRHCADEARHALLWAETIAELGLPTVRIFRSYQSFYGKHGATPASLPEVLALTHVFERRVWRQFQQDLSLPSLPAAVGAAIEQLLTDERQHLDWVAEWLRGRPEGADLLARYQTIDAEVYTELAPFEERLWDVPGLGVEL